MLKKNVVAAILALVFLMKTGPVYALDKIYSPNVNKGEVELEYAGSATFDGQHNKNNLQAHELEVEYGLTDRLMLEASASFEKETNESVEGHGVGFGGRYQFFEQGEHWLDSGLLLSYSHATHDGAADSLEVKLLLEKLSGNFLHKANIGIGQDVGKNARSAPDRVFLWSSRYRYNVHFEPGFEIQSDFGRADEHSNFNRQEHDVGPAVYGQIAPNLKYEAAYLFGISDAASAGAARVLLEYEMFF